MQKLLNALLVAGLVSIPALAGGFMIQAENPRVNPEATAKNAVILARVTSCQSPEKTVVTATAEGTVNGQRQILPLKVLHLSDSGAYAVAHEWPGNGAWTVKMTATNIDYKDYAVSLIVPVLSDQANLASAKTFAHSPEKATLK